MSYVELQPQKFQKLSVVIYLIINLTGASRALIPTEAPSAQILGDR